MSQLGTREVQFVVHSYIDGGCWSEDLNSGSIPQPLLGLPCPAASTLVLIVYVQVPVQAPQSSCQPELRDDTAGRKLSRSLAENSAPDFWKVAVRRAWTFLQAPVSCQCTISNLEVTTLACFLHRAE